VTLGATARGLLELTRPGNAVAAGVLTFTGAYVARADLLVALPAVAAAVVATLLATGGGNAVNDYFDRAVDAVNRPDRPIPRGAVSPRTALAFALASFVGAAAAAATLPVPALAIAAVNLAALGAYTQLFKGTPGVGNVVVAYLTGSTFLFGGAAVGRLTEPAVLVLFVLAGVATLTREIVKDVEDLRGDREEGLRTLPVAVGRRPALAAGAVAMLLAVAASPLPFVRGTFGVAYLAVVLPADALMLYATAESFSDPGRSQRRLKVGMFLAAFAFVAGRTATLLDVASLPLV
jgi:geranylgeranylglycerol-phosphate geranylgeranyltransferase